MNFEIKQNLCEPKFIVFRGSFVLIVFIHRPVFATNRVIQENVSRFEGCGIESM